MTPIARNLRRGSTEAETKLWHHLRNRQIENAKFRRQAPVGSFIADFLSEECRLIIELDGSQHVDSTTDRNRTDALESFGYRVIRIWNREVFENPDGILEEIRLAVLSARGH